LPFAGLEERTIGRLAWTAFALAPLAVGRGVGERGAGEATVVRGAGAGRAGGSEVRSSGRHPAS